VAAGVQVNGVPAAGCHLAGYPVRALLPQLAAQDDRLLLEQSNTMGQDKAVLRVTRGARCMHTCPSARTAADYPDYSLMHVSIVPSRFMQPNACNFDRMVLHDILSLPLLRMAVWHQVCIGVAMEQAMHVVVHAAMHHCT
jgi:hypothetical protein